MQLRSYYIIISLLLFSCTKQPVVIAEKKPFTVVQLSIAEAFAPIIIAVEKYDSIDITRLRYSERITFDTVGLLITYNVKTNIPYEKGVYQVRHLINTDSATTGFYIRRANDALPVIITGIKIKSYYR